MRKDGSVLGYVDNNADQAYQAANDKLVFVLEADKPDQKLYATDRYQNRYRVGVGDVLTFYLIGRMFDRHHGHYGRWHSYGYRNFHSPGYYGRWRTTRRWGSSSYGGRRSSGSWGRGGGWGGGK